MKVISLNVGEPREVEWRGEVVRTSIFKAPVEGPRSVRRLSVDGDRQSDLSVHGGAFKAVYAYSSEHYPYWRAELGAELTWGNFGENLTTEGLTESDTCIGDRYRAGGAELVVTQPRFPCYKLSVRFGRADMVKRFHRSGRSGIYFSVAAEGDVQAGDAIARLSRDERGLTVADFVRMYTGEISDPTRFEAAADHPGVPGAWREWFGERAAERRHARVRAGGQ